MTEAQADQIIDFLYGMLRPPDQEGTRVAWRIQLRHLDPDIASQALINGMQVWEHFPPWPVFYGEYRAARKALRAQEESKDAFSCKTCSDDGFVVVSLRRVGPSDWHRQRGREVPENEFIEEMAPCPDCNGHAETGFRRHDGTWATPLDPARVRAMKDS